MAAHSSTLAWKIPWMEKPGGVAKSRTRLSDFTLPHLKALDGGSEGTWESIDEPQTQNLRCLWGPARLRGGKCRMGSGLHG